jgi:hypothetical protein
MCPFLSPRGTVSPYTAVVKGQTKNFLSPAPSLRILVFIQNES